MTWANLSPLALAGGLAALAAILFALQRLRVRYRPVPVITTLFWREAVEEARARVFVRRFRHPLAYLLVLAIAGLIWLAVAEPQPGEADPVDRVLLLDASAGMAAGDRFDRTVAALLERARTVPPARRTVLACGEIVRPLLLPGEALPLLEARREGVGPTAAPASIERALRDLAATRDPARRLEVEVFGDAPIAEGVLALLPGVTVRRAFVEPGEPRGANAGVVALGVTPARSGAWDRVDVFVRGAGSGSAVTASVEGETGALGAPEAGASGAVVYRDVPAAGGTFRVRASRGDAIPFDDAARIVLPNRPRLRVALSPNAGVLRAVLDADPAVRLVTEDAAVAVRLAGETIGGDVPALELVDEAAQEEAFLLIHPRGLDSEEVLLESFDQLGLDEVDAMELAEAARKPIAIGAAPGDRRAVRVWSSLLEARYDFTRTRSFPLFVATSLRWLAEEDAAPAWAAAGEAVAQTAGGGAWTDARERQLDPVRGLDPVGMAFVPPVAGRFVGEDGRIVEASLLDPVTTSGGEATGAREASAGAKAPAGDLAALLAALALAGLLVEWWIYRTGRMP